LADTWKVDVTFVVDLLCKMSWKLCPMNAGFQSCYGWSFPAIVLWSKWENNIPLLHQIANSLSKLVKRLVFMLSCLLIECGSIRPYIWWTECYMACEPTTTQLCTQHHWAPGPLGNRYQFSAILGLSWWDVLRIAIRWLFSDG
jgi:hypothetical protein